MLYVGGIYMSYEDEKFRQLFNKLKSYSDDKEKYISEVIDNMIFLIINRRKGKDDVLDEKQLEVFSNYAKSILTDLYEEYIVRSESKNNIIEDVEYAGSGFYSITFRVGDNVIKIGKNSHATKPVGFDSKYQVPTYIRESYEVGDKIHFKIEVSPYVDTTNITYDDIYQAYSNIRSLGYIWNDPKEDNIGRIIGVSGCKIGGKQYLPSYQFSKGDLVVIDLEDIAYVGEETSDIILDEISMMSYNRNVYVFETRYMEEKKKNKVL